MHDDDLGLAKRLLAGDAAAYRQFFDDYFERTYRFVSRRVNGDLDLARDIAQSTLIKGMRALGSYRGEASLFTWFCQIARRELFNAQHRQGAVFSRSIRYDDRPEVRAALESLESSAAWDPPVVLQQQQSADAVHVVLDNLPPKYAKLLELKYLEDLSVAAIALRLGATPTAVQSMLGRARAAFEEGVSNLSGGIDSFGAIGSAER